MYTLYGIIGRCYIPDKVKTSRKIDLRRICTWKYHITAPINIQTNEHTNKYHVTARTNIRANIVLQSTQWGTNLQTYKHIC